MNFKKQWVLLAFLSFLWINALGSAPQSPVIFQSGKAEIELKDYLNQSLFWWPSTLLTYPVVFQEAITPGELILKDKVTGRQIPFQISDFQKNKNGKQEAVLYILTDLPSGGQRSFLLQKGTPERFTPVSILETGQGITVQTDKLEIRLPKSSGTQNPIPGPISGIGQRGSKFLGNSSFDPGKRTLKQLETKIVNQGLLFVEIEQRYVFSDGANYQANIRCVNSYDFVEIKEQMEGFPDADQAGWEIRWDGFSPTHRQAPNHPYGQPENTPGFGRYKWEKIDQSMLNSHHGIMYSPGNGKIPFEVGIFGNWPAERNVTSTVFWDEKGMQSVGAFTKDVSAWDDHEYSIWASSGKLNVKFYYNDQVLKWIYPVRTGTRSTGLSCYPHQNNINYMEELERLNTAKEGPRPRISQLSYNTFLQNRHSTIDLNKVKDWNLTYPEPLRIQPVIFAAPKQTARVQDLERGFIYNSYSNELAVSGPCQNSGYSPSPANGFIKSSLVSFNQLLPEMTPEQRERFSAMFLMHAYVAASEEYMPMRTMLSGHPNFLAEIRSIPAFVAFLFPEHSEADNWTNMFAKYVELNTHYHTRPDVKSWDAHGGRWTENLSCYVWGFLKSSIRANYLIQTYGNGKIPMANQNMAQVGNWILNALSAPYNGESLDFYKNKLGVVPQHFWGIATGEEGPRRIHPPQGAHAGRHKPAASFWLIGDFLQNYTPLLAENIRFVSSPLDEDFESASHKDVFEIMYPSENFDTGTPPDLKSMKMTGYGIVLRAAVGTKDELSIHLQQIDKGPNYRWGIAADGGCGNIYFYAAGKSYSHNGEEDSGDRKAQDTEMITNAGAFKDGYFKSIGMNELTRPLYDLSVGQFAEIIPSQEKAYSWPDYQSRSIMLVGSDYFITYDDVYNNNITSRFSWFTHVNESLPEITVIKYGGYGFDFFRFKAEKSEHIGRETKGLWYDGLGDVMTFVSHKKDFQITPAPYGSIITTPAGGKDYIFRNDTPVESDSAYIFSGTAGFIRERTDGKQEIALFHGTKIGNTQFEIHTENKDAGISAVYTTPDNMKGEYFSYTPTEITFRWTSALPSGINCFIDGEKQLPVKSNANEYTVSFPDGKHIWNLSKGLPALSRPEIHSTRNEKKSVNLTLKPVAGAQRYRYEYSADAGKTWKILKEQIGRDIRITPSGNEKKGFARVVALNAEHESEASVIYPLYFTLEKPHYPEGLKLVIAEDKVLLTWGHILGATESRLYKREIGSSKHQLIYKGSENRFEDKPVKGKLYEYVVTAVNGNGESEYSLSVNNDPDNWLNFNPVPGEPFRRVGTRSLGSDNMGNKVDIYYPE